mmetsp:Transcript_91761/g.163314  ORF Transcript_91761/g.163314 Transcript_91761/m.163314 type:complete len:534 (+) Transcript_91761:32-1633(+)
MAGNGGCADGLLLLLGMPQPFGEQSKQTKKEEFPLLCKMTSLVDPKHFADTSSDPFLISSTPMHCPELGDLVVLSSGTGVPHDFHLCPAVVTEVNPACCTLAILDASYTFMLDACKVGFEDITPLHSDWRLGKKLVLGGFKKKTLGQLNGLSATVCLHKRHGHPCFLEKPGSGDALHLMICVKVSGQEQVLLLEPKQLSPASPIEMPLPVSTSPPLVVEAEDLLEEGAWQKSYCPALAPKRLQEPSRPGLLGFFAGLLSAQEEKLGLESPLVCKLTSILPVDDCSLCSCSALAPIPEDIPSKLRSEACSRQVGSLERGDLIILSRSTQPEFHLCWAVVTTANRSDCTAAVLDGTRSFRIGSCKVNSADVIPVSHEWRIGSHLVINSLENVETRHLNGRRGIVHPHKRHCHPAFLTKPGDSNKSYLNICIRLEPDDEKEAASAVLLEPKFLSPHTVLESLKPRPCKESDASNEGFEQISAMKPGIGGYEKPISWTSTASGPSTARSFASEMASGELLLKEPKEAFADQEDHISI